MSDDPLVIYKDRPDARIAAVAPPAKPNGARRPRTGARKPLALRPVAGDDGKAGSGRARDLVDDPASVSGAPSVAAGLSAETLARAATMADVAEALDAAIAINLDGEGALRARIGELRGEVTRLETELARARATTAELKSKLHEVDFIVERLRIEGKGPPGARGDRGRDGPPGPRGERGERGEKGLPAPRIAAWEPSPDKFTVTPVYTNGAKGPPINLRALFEAYDDAVTEREADDLDQSSRESRVAAEAAAAASRWAK